MSEKADLTRKENSQKAKLLRAISTVEHDRKVNFYEVAVNKALFGIDGNTVLNKIVQKLIPDEAKIEHSGDIKSDINININKTYKGKAV